MEHTKNVFLDVSFLIIGAWGAYIYLSCPEEEHFITESTLVM